LTETEDIGNVFGIIGALGDAWISYRVWRQLDHLHPQRGLEGRLNSGFPLAQVARPAGHRKTRIGQRLGWGAVALVRESVE